MKPTLGYPSRIAAIIALRAQGLVERQIAERIGIRPNTVTSLEARHRARRGATVHILPETYADLQDEADARGLTPAQLAGAVLEAVAEHDLFAAVLDG